MPLVDFVWLAAFTKDEPDAGTDNVHNLIINIDGFDALDKDFALGRGGAAGLRRNQGGLASGDPLTFNTAFLTNSSVRLGIRGSNVWWPLHVFVFGRTEPGFEPSRTIALAMNWDMISPKLSTDSSEGKLTIPVPLVGSGSSATIIRRVLLLVHTSSGTDSALRLQIIAGGNTVLDREIGDTPQADLETGAANWYLMDATTPFTRADVLANGSIRLSILGSDAWLPGTVFLFGLDSDSGPPSPPSEVVTLVSIPEWTLGPMSTDAGEGSASILLQLAL